MVDPKDLPLRDIHLPPPIGWWPPAPGWWILAGSIAAVLLLGAVTGWWLRRTRLRRRARQRLAEIGAAYAAHQDRHRLARELSMLCRQVAVQWFGAADSAAVTGAAWLTQLDATARDRFFSEGPGRILAEAPYDPAASAFDARALLAGLERWLRRLPPSRRALPHV